MYTSSVKDEETLCNKIEPIQFNKCISNRNVNRNELPGQYITINSYRQMNRKKEVL